MVRLNGLRIIPAPRTSYGYDSNGNVTSITPPSPLGSTSIAPDALSRPSTVTDGKGQTTCYTYDKLDRITQILYGGATNCTSSTTCTTSPTTRMAT